jgi:hypothetical protein
VRGSRTGEPLIGQGYRHDGDDKSKRGRPVPMGCAGHLVQHAAGEAGCGQMRMDLGSAERQALSGTVPPLALKLRQ